MSNEPSLEIVEFEAGFQERALEVAEEVLCREHGLAVDVAEEPDLRDIATAYAAPVHRFVVAKDGERIVATGAVRHLSGDACELRRLYVLESHRRRGLASGLLVTLLDFIKERGYVRVWLEVTPEMGEKTRFASRYGFVPVDDDTSLPRPGRFLSLSL